MANLDLEEKILDLEDTIKNNMIEIIMRAFNEEKSEKAIADSIRRHLEEKEDGKWNVILGKDFGSKIVHKSRRYAYFQIGELSLLIWQS